MGRARCWGGRNELRPYKCGQGQGISQGGEVEEAADADEGAEAVGVVRGKGEDDGRAVRSGSAHLALADPRGRCWIVAVVSPGRVVKVKHEVTVI